MRGHHQRVALGLVVATSAAIACSPGLSGAHSLGRMTPVTHRDGSWLNRLPEQPAPRGGRRGRFLSPGARASATALTVLNSLPAVWCGNRTAADDKAHETNNGSHKYHAIYAVPADRPDRFAVWANTLQADAFEATELLQRQHQRAIRFDMGTSCGRQYLDISAVRLGQTSVALGAVGRRDLPALLAVLADELIARGFDALPLRDSPRTAAAKTRNYLVWLDGVGAGVGACGAASQYRDTVRDRSNVNNFGGKLAVVLRSGAGWCDSNTVRHEIGHTLGALLPGAPNAFDESHCNDAYEDTMCYPTSPRRGNGSYEGQFFDYGTDDYWDPPGGALGRWTVNLNQFVCPDIACNVAPDTSLLGGVVKAVDLVDVFDADGDATADLFGTCPQEGLIGREPACESNRGDAAGEVVLLGSYRPTVVLRPKWVRKGRWRITLLVEGHGRAVATVTCRRGGRRVRVLRRTLTAPRSVTRTVRCDSRPRVTARAL
jgi:hypothetical protein